MKFLIVKDYREMSKRAGEIILEEVKKKPNLVLGLASGKTTLGLYKELVKAYKKGVDFSKIKVFNLDEYYPIKKSDKRSFYYYFFKNLLKKINIKRENINLLNGETKNPEKECKEFEKKIGEVGMDVQILGVGVNGHIAFNEPGSTRGTKTRLVRLSFETTKGKVPRKALTQGVSTIMKSRKLLLLASGKSKEEAIEHLKDKEGQEWPVSFIKKHKDLTVIADKKAGGLK
jgi:glucosamine-6-phosphate deaminase